MLLPFLAVLPWVGLALFVALRVRLPPELPPPGVRTMPDGAPGPGPEREWPLVSVVIPARNEEHNIERVLASVTGSRYAAFEVIVVDDRSDDRTGELARSQAAGRARRLEVVDGEPLPAGWVGKPWACWQGARRARGEVILFTDADTVHGPELLARAVTELLDEEASAVTVAGRQVMRTFWERVVQPQIFLTMTLRYFDLSRPFTRDRWRSAIAAGQYVLVRRDVYDEVGGHERVRGEVVEDLRLAQELVRDGHRLLFRRAEDGLETRMYRSLGELVAGWSKNVVPGGLQTVPPWARPLTPPVMLLSSVVLWLVPPVALVSGLVLRIVPPAAVVPGVVGAAGTGGLAWAGATVTVSVLFWGAVTRRFGAPWYLGAAYPLGAAVATWIVLRSWLRGGDVEWKGRSYGRDAGAPGGDHAGR